MEMVLEERGVRRRRAGNEDLVNCSCPLCGSALGAHEIGFKEGFVFANGAAVGLTSTECAIFERLLKAFPGFVAKGRLYHVLVSRLFTEADWPSEKAVDAHICNIRKKIGSAGLKIETAWGRGYRLVHGMKIMEAARIGLRQGDAVELAPFP